MDRNEKSFSIGALSTATGVPVETLRTWERRYGFPAASRTASGHRRYAAEVIERLRRVKLALDRGHRPSTVLGLSDVELDRLLGWSGVPTTTSRARSEPHPGANSPETELIAQWLVDVQSGDLDSLERKFRTAWHVHSAVDFIELCAAPFLVEVGERWERGELSVMQEHASSQRLRDFLAEQWRPLSDRSQGLRVICGTLSGDYHDLGAHMAATTLAVRGAKVIYLGSDTPAVELARAVSAFGAVAVAVSISAAYDNARATSHLTELRHSIPAPISIVVGGSGAPQGIDGVHIFPHLHKLADWFSAINTPMGADVQS